MEVSLRDGELTVCDHGPGIAPEDLLHVFDLGCTPWARRISATFAAIHASPAAVGCRPSGARANVHPPASVSMMITWGSAALPAATMARSVRAAAARRERSGKTVSSAIWARGASARINATALRYPPLLKPRRYPDVVVTGLRDDQRRGEATQVDPGDLGGDRPQPAGAGPHVARPGIAEYHGVPVQPAGQQDGP